MEWEAETEIQDQDTHVLQINNKKYAALADEEDNKGNENESTGVDNDSKITGVRQDNKITGVDSDNESAE